MFALFSHLFSNCDLTSGSDKRSFEFEQKKKSKSATGNRDHCSDDWCRTSKRWQQPLVRRASLDLFPEYLATRNKQLHERQSRGRHQSLLHCSRRLLTEEAESRACVTQTAGLLPSLPDPQSLFPLPCSHKNTFMRLQPAIIICMITLIMRRRVSSLAPSFSRTRTRGCDSLPPSLLASNSHTRHM